MNDLIPVEEKPGLLAQARDAAAAALARAEDVKLVRWIREILDAAKQFAAMATDAWRYARQNRRQFHGIVRALESGDGDSRLCAKACRFIHDNKLRTRDDKQQFATWVCFAYQDDSSTFVSNMATKARESISINYDRFARLL
ncbi:MAG: hypothetical protein AB7U20_06705 [Planctomycetaceae bacterium]